MKKFVFALFVLLVAAPSFAQTGVGAGAGAGSNGDQATTSQSSTNQKEKEARAVPPKVEEVQMVRPAEPGPKFVRSNVQIELTLSDQVGSQAPEKKTVTMVVSSGSWGKIRSAGNVRPQNDAPFVVDLSVDARPNVFSEGQVQLELTIAYSPPGGADKDTLKPRPTGVNQSLTVLLQSGKPLLVSQMPDPFSDRKVIVELKATILK